MNAKQREEELTLEVLAAIEQNSDLTQRHLARRMGVALGLANSYLTRCVRKGLIKIQHAPANRYLYYLTPKGFTEKSRLTADYLTHSFRFYQQAAKSCVSMLATCKERSVRRIGLYGASDLAEITAVKAIEEGFDIVCLCDPSGERKRFLSFPVVRSVDAAPSVDVWLFTGMGDLHSLYDELVQAVGADRVLSPSILGIDRAGVDDGKVRATGR